MASIQTYQGIVQEGRIQLSSTTQLPEGSHVYVIVAGQSPVLEERIARRKATRWLVEYVGHLLTALEGRLVEIDGRIAWRFDVYMTARGHQPRGPIGTINIDSQSGEVLANEQHINEIIANGEAFSRSLLSAEG